MRFDIYHNWAISWNDAHAFSPKSDKALKVTQETEVRGV
jgi:hypothetical protein